MNTNNENPKIGKLFQIAACKKLSEFYNQPFQMEVAIGIGNPPKVHRFDLANKDHSIVCECKCYSWTETGNIPSAKMSVINEAIFYLSFLPPKAHKVLVLSRSAHRSKSDTLAEYYFRINRHLLDTITILEYDLVLDCLRQICQI